MPPDIRSYRNGSAAPGPCPFFDGGKQCLPNPTRTDLFVYDQSTGLSTTIQFDCSEDKRSDPAGNLPSLDLSNIDGVLLRILHSREPHPDLVTGARVAELTQQNGHRFTVVRFGWSKRTHRLC